MNKFKIGDKVLCNLGDFFLVGEIIKIRFDNSFDIVNLESFDIANPFGVYKEIYAYDAKTLSHNDWSICENLMKSQRNFMDTLIKEAE